MNKKYKIVAFRATADQVEKLEKYAQKLDRPLSWLLRKALEKYVNELEGGK